MCDEANRIITIVRKCKEVEKSIGRELGQPSYKVIIEAFNNNSPFEIDGVVFEWRDKQEVNICG